MAEKKIIQEDRGSSRIEWLGKESDWGWKGEGKEVESS